jgi:hypothetical protein
MAPFTATLALRLLGLPKLPQLGFAQATLACHATPSPPPSPHPYTASHRLCSSHDRSTSSSTPLTPHPYGTRAKCDTQCPVYLAWYTEILCISRNVDLSSRLQIPKVVKMQLVVHTNKNKHSYFNSGSASRSCCAGGGGWRRLVLRVGGGATSYGFR